MKSSIILLILLAMTTLVSCGKPITIPLDKYDDIATHIDVGNATNVITNDKISFVASNTGFHVVDHNDFENVQILASIPVITDDLMFIDDVTIATVKAGGKLVIIDVADITNPTVIFNSVETFPGPFVGVGIDGDKLVVASGRNGIFFYQLANYIPLLIATYSDNTFSQYNDIAIHDNQIFLSVVDREGNIGFQNINFSVNNSSIAFNVQSTTLTELSIESAIFGAAHFPLQVAYAEGDFWMSGAKGIKKIVESEEDAKEFAFTKDIGGMYIHEYAAVGFHGDIEGHAHVEQINRRIHFQLTTEGTALAGNYDEEQIVAADGDKGFLVVDVEKLIELAEEIMGGF